MSLAGDLRGSRNHCLCGHVCAHNLSPSLHW